MAPRGRPSKQRRNTSGLRKRQKLASGDASKGTVTVSEGDSDIEIPNHNPQEDHDSHTLRSAAPSPEPIDVDEDEGYGEGWEPGVEEDSLQLVVNSEVDGGEEESDVEEDLEWGEFSNTRLRMAMLSMAREGEKDSDEWLPQKELTKKNRKFTRKDTKKTG